MKKLFLVSMIALAMASCSDGNKYTVSGTIAGASDEKLVLQRPFSGGWLTIDSIETDSDGQFEFKEEAPQAPEVMRVGRNGKFIYFPIDSIDNITIQADTVNFETSYRLAGSKNAVWMMQVDSICRLLAANPADSALVANNKMALSKKIMEDPSSIVAYYTINKFVGNEHLFSIYDNFDVRIMGAVANAYVNNKPNDPRTELLKSVFFQGRRNTYKPNANAPKDTIYADQSQIIDIELFDKNGQKRKLSDVAKGGKVVLLNFTTYLAEESPALNVQLADLYKANVGRGFEIYQVGYDDNEFNWKSAAKNLPWVTVYDPSGVQSQYLLKYNIGVLPAMFIINRQGELAERVLDLNKLQSTVAKYM